MASMRRMMAAGAVVMVALLAAGCSGEDTDAGPFTDASRTHFRTCASCHGTEGQGGIGPALDGVVDTFPSCDAHIEWVTLGSNGWLETHGDTYGATAKPVDGGMPGFAATLGADEIAAIAAYQRHRFADVPQEVALSECVVTE